MLMQERCACREEYYFSAVNLISAWSGDVRCLRRYSQSTINWYNMTSNAPRYCCEAKCNDARILPWLPKFRARAVTEAVVLLRQLQCAVQLSGGTTSPAHKTCIREEQFYLIALEQTWQTYATLCW